MPIQKKQGNLTARDADIMSVIWGSEKPLLASEIAAISELSINTVNAALKKLLNGGVIKVADIVHSGTVLSRRYNAVTNQNEYITKQFVGQIKNLKKPFSTPKLVAALLEHEKNEKAVIAELEEFLQERRNELQGGK